MESLTRGKFYNFSADPRGTPGAEELPLLPSMTSTKGPANQHQLKELNSAHNSLADIIGQLHDIDPSRLSFSPFLDLDTQISMAPISDSPESSVEELYSTEEEEGVAPLNPATENLLEPVEVGHKDDSRSCLIQESPGPPEIMEDPKTPVEEATTFQDSGHTLTIRMPKETSFLDMVPVPLGCSTEPVVEEQQAGALELPDPPLPLHEHQPFLEVGSTDPVPCGDSENPAPCTHKCCQGWSGDHMKAVASAFVSLLLAPWFLYGCYYFLPLQAPACPDLASRVVFALRCLLIAGVPILLGIMLRAFSVLCLDAPGPLDARSRPALLHQLFVSGSVDQFVVFCLNVVVTATFLPQEHLRLVPIFAGLFSVGRCCYWVSLHLCSAYRGFGSGLSFFPTLSLTAYNLFCLFELGFGFLFTPSLAG
ncbi:transmembrane protein 79-like [Hemicordylus capensis]|uniref:transmembrane protein 79-like n=1 Tax=Hemicordylus capensis TaxID=884348 RepID=UPI0023027251|nr:transmembrane protein 79-like [Hemicordylus capensis]